MILWLPYESFGRSASVMDSRTLSIQRYDAWRLLHLLTKGIPEGMKVTPTILMWKNYPSWVACYGMATSLEWEARSNKKSEITEMFRHHLDVADVTDPYPPWLGDSVLHLSHRSNMIRLDPDHYMTLWPDLPEGLPLVFYEKGE